MRFFIFYTSEGFTEDNQHRTVENCQILGWGKGESPEIAFKNFVKNNKFLKQLDFNEVMCQELVNDKVNYFSLKD